MTKNYDVVVVGARVAGSSTALLLARAGLRVALVERAAHGSDTVSTHGLMRAGVLQLSRWGVLEDVAAAGTPPISRTSFHYAEGGSLEVTIRPSAGVPALFAPRRHLLDRLLVDAAAHAGVEVRHEVTVVGVLRDRTGRAAGVRTIDRSGRTDELHGRLTVGADGIRSTVAEQVAAPVIRRVRRGGAVLYRYYADACPTGYEWAYGPGAGAGFLPTNDDLTAVFVATRPERLRTLRREGVEQAFAALLAAAAPRLADRIATAQPASRMHGWAGAAGFLRRPWGPGWALVGDASHFKDPITTHGMTDALRDAELLADAILETVSGAASESAALSLYEATRDELSGDLFDVTERVASFAWSSDELPELLRQVSSAMKAEVDHLQPLPGRGASRVASC